MPSPKKEAVGPSRHTRSRSLSDQDHQIHRPRFYTIGHATRAVSELVAMLHEHKIKVLVDIRTIPRSRTNPQHNKEKLEKKLPTDEIQYLWLGKELGGLRKVDKSLGDMNAGWYNASFRGYADYMQSSEFTAGLRQLIELAEATDGPCALMCAETYYKRCHRSLVSDALTAHGYEVLHITALGKPAAQHHMTQFAKIEKSRPEKERRKGTAAKKDDGEVIKITYPPNEDTEDYKKYARKKDKTQPRIDSILKKK